MISKLISFISKNEILIEAKDTSQEAYHLQEKLKLRGHKLISLFVKQA